MEDAGERRPYEGEDDNPYGDRGKIVCDEVRVIPRVVAAKLGRQK